MIEDIYIKKLAKLKAKADHCQVQSKILGKKSENEASAKFRGKAQIIEVKIQRACDKLAVHSGQLKDKECYYRAMGKLEKAEKVAGRIKSIKGKIKEYQKI